MTISVKIETDWEECGHAENGCSGAETIKITAEEYQRKFVTVSKTSCFGISMEALIAELIQKWDAA